MKTQSTLIKPHQSLFPHLKLPFISKLSLAQKDAFFGYLFIAPQVLGYLCFVLGPIIMIFYNSLQTHNLLSGKTEFVGLNNFINMFTADPLFRKVFSNSLVFTIGLITLNLPFSLFLAILLAPRFPGVTFFRTLFFAPVVTSTVAWTLIWSFMLQGQQGLLNQALSLVGIVGPNWLREPGWAMASVIVIRVLKNVGLNMVLFLAAMQNLPKEHVEAAQIDGANRLNIVRYIILPHLSPTILLVTIITIIYSLNVFDHIMMLTSGGPNNSTMVLSYYVYHTAFKVNDIGYASSNAVILFLVALGLTVLQWSIRRRIVDNESN